MTSELGLRFRHGPPQRSRRLCEDTASGLAWADYDGDGDFDLYAVNDCGNTAVDNMPLTGGQLFRNDGDRFTDVTELAGVANPAGRGMAASWADFDDDGFPDLFYTNWLAQENGLYQSLLMPDGAIEYRDRARPVRLAEDSLEMVGWGCGFADLDLDGRADLVIVNGNTLSWQRS